jgi:quercetin dioxygenase-like cupin family protein
MKKNDVPIRVSSELLKSLFLALLLAQIAVAAQSISVKYAPPAQSTVLGTTFVDWDSLTVRTTAVGEQRPVFDNPTPTLEKLEVHITTLNPGMESHPVHNHAWEEMLLIKEGDVEVSINGQKHRAGPGYLIFFASHDVHNLRNVGDKPATYYVINFYTDLVHSVPDKPAAEQAVPGMLASSVIDCDSSPSAPTATGSRATVVDSATLTFVRLQSHITTLNVGQSMPPDIVDPGDELFIVKSGAIEARVNGVAARINEGSFFYCAPNDKRTLRNIGTTPAVYQVIRVVSDRTPK